MNNYNTNEIMNLARTYLRNEVLIQNGYMDRRGLLTGDAHDSIFETEEYLEGELNNIFAKIQEKTKMSANDVVSFINSVSIDERKDIEAKVLKDFY